jgi:PIN domain nuclease of toxin-antitoxin system
MRGYLLDTCAWIDSLLAPEKLRQPVRRIIGSKSPLHLSSVSLLEFARKEARGEISLSMPCAEWFERIALPKGKIILLDVIPPIAVDATRLPQPFLDRQGNPHKDPMDLVIVATARHHDLTLLTSDRVLLDYSGVRTENSR